MTTYLLDTNTCIALINGTETSFRRRFRRVLARESVVLLSSIVTFELWYGVAKSQRKDHPWQRLAAVHLFVRWPSRLNSAATVRG